MTCTEIWQLIIKKIMEEKWGIKNHVFVQVFNKVALKVESLDSSK